MNTKRRGFTLVELLMVMAIIALLMTLLWGAMWHAESAAREAATKSYIRSISAAIEPRFEEYEVRRLPRGGNPTSPQAVRQFQLAYMRGVAAVENPDQWLDIGVQCSDIGGLPNSVSQQVNQLQNNVTLQRYLGYVAQVKNTPPGYGAPSATFQGAECLYMIVKYSRIENRDHVLDKIPTGDFDNDGYMEFWDAWGFPISWIRWPYGYASDAQPSPIPSPLPAGVPDNMTYIAQYHTNLDPAVVDQTATGVRTLPLIFSAGPDQNYHLLVPRNKPVDPNEIGAIYTPFNQGNGAILSVGAPSGPGAFDNITNHYVGVR